MVVHQPHNTGGQYNYNIRFYTDDVWYAHFHQNIELIYVIRGKIAVSVGEQTFTAAADDFVMVLPGEIHSITVEEVGAYFIIVFSDDFVAKFRTAIQDKRAESSLFRCEETVSALFRRYIMTDEGDLLMKKACLYAVCSEFLKENRLMPRSTVGEPIAGRVLDYIAEHYHEDISLISCAEALGYEYHYLSRLLRNSYGIRFRKILNEYRIREATELLTKGDQTVAEIALACGFQSIRGFNDVFKKHTGRSPSDYGKRS